MDTLEKLKILSDAAKYDVSCSSSGSRRKNKSGGIGNASPSGICHSWADDGRCISLLKILFTNNCVYDCTYCINRRSNDVKRTSFTPREVADLTINFYKRNYIEGLFLSSAVMINPNHTMELLIRTVEILRNEYNFNGYIHLKGIPGADMKLIRKAGTYADRMSVNIELPSDESLKLLAPQKKKNEILKPMSNMKNGIIQYKEEKKKFRSTPKFIPAGQTTQLMVGATSDNDLKILKLSENLYKSFNLKRVYYSAYVPVLNHPTLPDINTPPLLREHRIYQADWLLRFYGYQADELLNVNKPNFDIDLDPKCDWALSNINMFPMEINRASYDELLRIPGIGVKSARRIVGARKYCQLSYDNLKKLGVVLKRAKFFITCKGKFYGDKSLDSNIIKQHLLFDKNKKDNSNQVTFMSLYPEIFGTNIVQKSDKI